MQLQPIRSGTTSLEILKPEKTMFSTTSEANIDATIESRNNTLNDKVSIRSRMSF